MEETLTAISNHLARIESLTRLTAKKVLNIEETSLLTGLSLQYLYQLTQKKQIPHYKNGKYLYFSKSEIEEWLTSNKVYTEDEINSMASLHLYKQKNNKTKTTN